MINPSNRSDIHSHSILNTRPEATVDRAATLPSDQFFPSDNVEPVQLPLAAPEDSDLDTVSIVSNRVSG